MTLLVSSLEYSQPRHRTVVRVDDASQTFTVDILPGCQESGGE